MPAKQNTDSFEDLMERASESIEPICRALREIIYEVHPEAVEVIHLGYNSASYGLGPKKMSEAHTYIIPHKAHANLGFYYGVDLPDPEGLMEGTGKKLRHVKIKSIEDAKASGIVELVRAALEERINTLGRG